MTILWILLLIVFIFALLSERILEDVQLAESFNNKSSRSIFAGKLLSHHMLMMVLLTLSLFSGGRTSYNDTNSYIYNFLNKIPTNFSDAFQNIDLSLGNNPGFYLYQTIIKSIISNDPQVFIFITAIITNTLFIWFYRRYSNHFPFSVFLFIASGLFIFGMAAMKQSLAMAIGVWAIHFLIQKKWLHYITTILLAATIHPYILLFFVATFLFKKVWSKEVLIIFSLTMLAGISFEKFVGVIIGMMETIGDTYSEDYILGKKGMNVWRVAVFSVIPILSFLFKKEINEKGDKLLIISTNLSIVSFLFMFLGSFGGANMFGRMGNYFEPFIYIALPWMILNLIDHKFKAFIIGSCILFYCIFFYYQFGIVKEFTYRSIFF